AAVRPGLLRLEEGSPGDDALSGPEPAKQHLVQRPDALDVIAAVTAKVSPPLARLNDVRLVPRRVERAERPDCALAQQAPNRRVDPECVRCRDELGHETRVVASRLD